MKTIAYLDYQGFTFEIDYTCEKVDWEDISIPEIYLHSIKLEGFDKDIMEILNETILDWIEEELLKEVDEAADYL